MKRIAIFCDGTWNRADRAFQTNVVKLAQATRPRDAEGTVQATFYQQGVGTGRGSSALARWLDRVLGGALGWGLIENIEEIYRWLVFTYEPGDEIHIFGFSRGAYTARSLAGLLRSCGIPARDDVGRIPEALARYRSRERPTHPNSEASFAFRMSLCPGLTTSPEEAAWRAEHGHPEGRPLSISYLGVWDTVGALGVPPQFRLLAMLFNHRYQFHDAALSRSVAAARHAVAVDERRRSFTPTLWDNLDTLNGGAEGRDRRYLQEWFPGDHGSIGGGGDIVGLSNIALLWIAEGAVAANLAFDADRLEAFWRDTDMLAPLINQSAPPSLVTRLTRLWSRDRDGPEDVTDVSDAARGRWGRDPEYRPPTLSQVAGALNSDRQDAP